MAEGLRSYIERMRSEGKPLYFSNVSSGHPESWSGGEGDVYSRPEETWNKETEAELNRRASGFDYSEDVGQRFPLLKEDKQGQTGTAGGQQSKGYILNNALAELQNHIPSIVKHTLGGKSKPSNAQEKRAVQQNIKSYLSMIMTDMEKSASSKTQKQKEFEHYKGLPGEDKALYAKTFGKSGSGESFAQKEQYKYLVGSLEELDKKLHGEWSEDLTDEERAKIQTERKTILDGMVELENTMGKGGAGPGMQRSQGTGKMAGQAMDKRSAIKMAVDAGASKEDIKNFLKQNPDVSVDNFLSRFRASNAEASTGQKTAAQAPDVKNTPINTTRQQATPDSATTSTGGALQRKNVPYNTSMTEGPTEEQRTAAKQELTDLARKLGVGPENWKALGQLAKDLGGWAWETYTNALNTLNQGQQEAREQLPGYRG